MEILDQIREVVENVQDSIKPFDPNKLNDDVAMKTDWTPVKIGGANRQIYEFIHNSTYKLEIKVKPLSFLFPIIFMMTGFVPMIMGILLYFKFQNIQITLFTIPFGLSFFTIGIFIFLSYKKSHFFDKSNGYYWKGKANNIESAKHKCWLIHIHALQILQEHIRRSTSSSSYSTSQTSYNSYEINLVLKDGSRFNVLDHAEKHKILEEAEKISQFLDGKPVWNATI